jgi:hypothetical protein
VTDVPMVTRAVQSRLFFSEDISRESAPVLVFPVLSREEFQAFVSLLLKQVERLGCF